MVMIMNVPVLTDKAVLVQVRVRVKVRVKVRVPEKVRVGVGVEDSVFCHVAVVASDMKGSWQSCPVL